MAKLAVIALVLLASFQVSLADNDYKGVDGLDYLGYENDFEKLAECQIFNSKYKSWFLNSEKVAYSNERRNITLTRFGIFDDKKQAMWRFEPVKGVKNGFYLKNSKYGESIYATTSFTGFNPFTQKRRKVYTWRMSKDIQMDPKSFIWIVSKTNRQDNEYYIYNLAHRE